MWDLQCWQLSQGSSVFDESPAQLEIGDAALVVILEGNFPFVTVTTVSQLWRIWNMSCTYSQFVSHEQLQLSPSMVCSSAKALGHSPSVGMMVCLPFDLTPSGPSQMPSKRISQTVWVTFPELPLQGLWGLGRWLLPGGVTASGPAALPLL